MKRWILFGLIGSVFLWGAYQIFFSHEEDVTAVQDEPQPRETQDIDSLIEQALLNYEELKSQHDTIEVNHEQVEIEDPEVKNWIIHTHIQSAVIQNEELEGITLVDQAMAYKHNNETIIEWANNEHGIEVTHEEIQDYIQTQLNYIESGKQARPFFVKISEALDLSEAEYLYEWEYDRFAQNLVQEKLFFYYKEKYPQEDDESLEEYEKRIIELMEQDLTEYDEAR
ncbi:hypothetical protein [Piscibacillus halophilus]|uniref:hypothetical protein n=1 Tax=Piscibacillus halophilus TaxID=571933 RepID=UPI00158B4C7E|nr:hypothetical protein [Piscibacillus halophilus]